MHIIIVKILMKNIHIIILYANIITNLQYLQFMKEVAGQVFETAALSCDC